MMDASIHLSEITRKHVSRCLLLLASDFDGEVLAAAAALRRVLAAAGCDLHDLVALLDAPGAYPQPPQQSHPESDWRSTVECLLEHGNCCLNEWECGFLLNVSRYRRGPTDKQFDLIQRFERRVNQRHKRAA